MRNLDEAVKTRLRVQAAENGRSMEAKARAILAAALLDCSPERGLGSRIHAGFAEVGGVELDLPDRDEPARAAELPE